MIYGKLQLLGSEGTVRDLKFYTKVVDFCSLTKTDHEANAITKIMVIRGKIHKNVMK